MQDGQAQYGDSSDGLFGRWRARLSQALLRDPAVVLIDRPADALYHLPEPDSLPHGTGEMAN